MLKKTRDLASVEALWHLRHHGYPETMRIASKEAEVRSIEIKVQTVTLSSSQEISITDHEIQRSH
jgi:hypothetical protein